MHVKVRLLTGQTKTVEVDDGATIATLKDLFADEYIRDTIKFVFKGKTITAEETPLSSVLLTENDAIVLVGKKTSLHNIKKAPQQATMAEEFKAARHIRSPAESRLHAEVKPEAAQAPDVLVSNEVVESIVSMGFEKNIVIEALRQARYNPDLAVEYCLSGISQTPIISLGETFDPLEDHNSPARAEDLVHLENLLSGQASPEVRETELVKALRSLPNFEQIRLMSIGKEPSLIPTVIDEIERCHPALHCLIQRVPEEFMRLVAHGLPPPSEETSRSISPPTIRVDPAPIQRLMDIGGFSQEEATKAYILANHNEDMAASILFEALEQTMGGDNASN